ncbi:hypothetical protein [Agrococcus versicolor]
MRYTHESASSAGIETDENEFELLDASTAEDFAGWPREASVREFLTLAGVTASAIDEYEHLDESVEVGAFLTERLERFPAWDIPSQHFEDGRLHRLASRADGAAAMLGGGGSSMGGWDVPIVGTLAAFEHVAAHLDASDALLERDDDLVRRARALLYP